MTDIHYPGWGFLPLLNQLGILVLNWINVRATLQVIELYRIHQLGSLRVAFAILTASQAVILLTLILIAL